MIYPLHLREEIIRPALEVLGMWSPAAEELMLGTAAAESHCGTYLRQRGGPALGVWQVEPATHRDVWRNYLQYRPDTAARVARLVPPLYADGPEPLDHILVSCPLYCAAIARLVYRRGPEPLAEAGDWGGHAALWKKRYNTVRGRGTVDHFLQACRDCGLTE